MKKFTALLLAAFILLTAVGCAKKEPSAAPATIISSTTRNPAKILQLKPSRLLKTFSKNRAIIDYISAGRTSQKVWKPTQSS